jgi:D-3-phosphoglycerate dehydrogenase
MMKVLITCPPMLKNIQEFIDIFKEKNVGLVLPDILQTLTEEQLTEILPAVDGWIIGDDPATEKVFAAGKSGKLKAAVKWGVGVDNVDFNAAKKLGIPVTNTPKMFGNEVADVVISYVTGLARQTYFIDREIRKGNWVKPTGISLTGKTIAIIGMGDIGSATARRLRGFDVRLFGYDPHIHSSNNLTLVDEKLMFPSRIGEADFVILSCSLNESTRHIINDQTIALLKDGVYLINVSRGALIDEQALVKALASGKIKAAALEVCEHEPLPADSALRQFDQCIFGSHNGSNAIEGVRRASLRAIELLFGYLNLHSK